MRKAIAWPVAWGLFWAGHFVSRALVFNGLAFFYPAYNNLMYWSTVVQDWGAISSPWGPMEKAND